jgi:alkanesulfonate monooxygenase SsuD/methylene tetrahydromethanopterin reductase-like flavin-dependent oxidoreductase (luciferase family)
MHIGLSGWQREGLLGDPQSFLTLMERADRLGFGSIWLNELHFAARRGQSPDEVPPRPRAQFLREQAIAGDPQACFEQVATLARGGASHLRLVFNGAGVLDDQTALGRMELFAREVLPACQAL